MTLVDLVNGERTVDNLQLIKSVINSYNFIDYAIVKTWADGIVDVTLAHPIQGEDVILTNVEVLSHGAKCFSAQYELIAGDVVQLFSSRSFIETIADFIGVGPRVISAYDIATIKAVPVTGHGAAFNKLTIEADGSYTLIGENYSLTVDAAGDITLEAAKNFTVTTVEKQIYNASVMELNGNGKQFVTWTELDTALRAHTHSAGLLVSSPSGGPVTGTTGIPAVFDIATAKTTTVLTNG